MKDQSGFFVYIWCHNGDIYIAVYKSSVRQNDRFRAEISMERVQGNRLCKINQAMWSNLSGNGKITYAMFVDSLEKMKARQDAETTRANQYRYHERRDKEAKQAMKDNKDRSSEIRHRLAIVRALDHIQSSSEKKDPVSINMSCECFEAYKRSFVVSSANLPTELQTTKHLKRIGNAFLLRRRPITAELKWGAHDGIRDFRMELIPL